MGSYAEGDGECNINNKDRYSRRQSDPSFLYTNQPSRSKEIRTAKIIPISQSFDDNPELAAQSGGREM